MTKIIDLRWVRPTCVAFVCLFALVASGMSARAESSTTLEALSPGAARSGALRGAYPMEAPRSARRKARVQARKRWPKAQVVVTDSYRSKRDRRWVLVNGEAKPRAPYRPWSTWLRKRGRSWRVVLFADHPGAAGPEGVPCDISYAYSESSC